MKGEKSKSRIVSSGLVIVIGLLLLPRNALSFCHEIELVWKRAALVALASELTFFPSLITDRVSPFTRRVAAGDPKPVLIEWFGHATFQITSSKGTRILTDPHTRDYLPWPTLPQHIVTTSHNHEPHSNLWMARGDPVILRGLSEADDDWNPIHRIIRDVSIYAVPAYHDKSQGLQRGKNAIFVFRVDGICIAHLGDLGHRLTPAQLKMLGKIDILLVPIGGGRYTITAEEAQGVTRQVQPRIAIPMHYWQAGAAERFTQGAARVRRINGPTLRISKNGLPEPTQIVVLSWDHY